MHGKPLPRSSRSSSWGGLKRTTGDTKDNVVKREPRIEIRGVSLLMQKHSLILNQDTGESIPCRVSEISANGYRLTLQPGREMPESVQVDNQLVLALEKQGSWLVDVRWVNKTQCGLKKLKKL